MDNTIIQYTHSEPEITTVGGLIFRSDQSSLIQGLSATELLEISYVSSDNVIYTNRQSLFDRYTEDEKKDQEGKSDSELLLKVNTLLVIPKNKLRKELLFTQTTQLVKNTDYKTFMSGLMQSLLSNPAYQKSYNSTKGVNTTVSTIPDLTVWMWCRALSSPGGVEGNFINITPFIQQIQTNVGREGGNWSMVLTPLVCEYDETLGWFLTPENIKNFSAENLKSSYSAQYQTHKVENGELFRNKVFFHQIIQSNDLIFIRFETLELEREQREKDSRKFYLSGSDIPHKIYDMIGMVDTNQLAEGFSNNEISISVTGRDLIKMLIEDGSYFFPLEFSGGVFYNAGGAQGQYESGNSLVQRSAVDGKLLILDAYLERSIQFSMQFIINQLSNTGFVPDSVFAGYDDASDRYVLDNTSIIESYESEGEGLNQTVVIYSEKNTKRVRQKGVWQIFKLIVDASVSNRRIVDSSIAEEQGSILNSIRKICQEPLVEFYTDTYGDSFYATIRKPPFDAKGFRGLIYNDVALDKAEFKKKNFYETINGATLRSGIQFNSRDGLSDLVIDIEESDILSTTLEWNDSEIYSWYRLQPNSMFWGKNSQMTWAYIPAVYFPEYAEIWGSKPLMLETNYQPFFSYGDMNEPGKQNYIERQCFYDYQYLIQSNAYLPFTRKGGIVLAKGDRRLKRGCCLRLKATDEIFYIDSVQQNYQVTDNSIDRGTNLQVSRGMKEKYIKGVSIPGIKEQVSYFNIINTEINESFFQIKKQTVIDAEGTKVDEVNLFTKSLSNFRVNKDIFNFFLTRRQFA